MTDEEFANRELCVTVAEAAMRFADATGGPYAVGISSPIDGSIAVFRAALRRAFDVRHAHNMAGVT
jgi:hypothetical protein